MCITNPADSSRKFFPAKMHLDWTTSGLALLRKRLCEPCPTTLSRRITTGVYARATLSALAAISSLLENSPNIFPDDFRITSRDPCGGIRPEEASHRLGPLETVPPESERRSWIGVSCRRQPRLA